MINFTSWMFNNILHGVSVDRGNKGWGTNDIIIKNFLSTSNVRNDLKWFIKRVILKFFMCNTYGNFDMCNLINICIWCDFYWSSSVIISRLFITIPLELHIIRYLQSARFKIITAAYHRIFVDHWVFCF